MFIIAATNAEVNCGGKCSIVYWFFLYEVDQSLNAVIH